LYSKISTMPERLAQQEIGESCVKNCRFFFVFDKFFVIFYNIGTIFAERERERERESLGRNDTIQKCDLLGKH